MLSQTVEYALRAVVHLAMRAPEPQTTATIAEVTQVPPAYLAKVLQGLKEKNIVHLQRGIGGGVSLAQSPDKLTILDVVNAVDPIKRINRLPAGSEVARNAIMCVALPDGQSTSIDGRRLSCDHIKRPAARRKPKRPAL